MERNIIVFANSVKHGNHCVAGKDIKTKEWIRPVSSKESEQNELKDHQCTCEGEDSPVKLLQVVKIELTDHISSTCQPENYLFSNTEWILRGYVEREKIISSFLDKPDKLWIDGQSYMDRVNYDLIKKKEIIISQSLYLIRVYKIVLYWKDRPDKNPQRRAHFEYNKMYYDFALTDPNFENFEEEELFDRILCISLGGEFNNYCYKIIASIF